MNYYGLHGGNTFSALNQPAVNNWYAVGSIHKMWAVDVESQTLINCFVLRQNNALDPVYIQTSATVNSGDIYSLRFNWRYDYYPADVDVTWSCDSNNWNLIFSTNSSFSNPYTNTYILKTGGTGSYRAYTNTFTPQCSSINVRFRATYQVARTSDVLLGPFYLLKPESYCKCNSNYARDASSECNFACPVNAYCTGTNINLCPSDSYSPALSTDISSCSCISNKSLAGNSCKCPNSSFPWTNFYSKFESTADVEKFPSGLYTDLIYDSSKCVSGSCVSWLNSYAFTTNGFSDPNVFSFSFWFKGVPIDQFWLFLITGPGSPVINGNSGTNFVRMITATDHFTIGPDHYGQFYGNWFHLAITFSYGLVTVYGGALSATTTPISRQYSFTPGPVNVALYPPNPTYYFDEFAVFPTILTASDVQLLRKGPLPLCKTCPVNSYCSGDAITACPTGSSSPAGSTLASQCVCSNAQQIVINNKCSCPSGKFLSGGNCVTCPAGMVCAVTFDAATCSQGSYCPIGSITETPCLAGSYCTTPSTQVQCPINTYCPAGTVTPIACQTNYISPVGSTLLAQCEAAVITVDFAVDGASVNINQSQFQNALPSNVALNSYEDVLVLTQGACPQGYYCPVDTTTAIPCPASTFNNGTNAVSLADCRTCLVGQYCPLASTIPVSCAAGSYRIVEGAAQQSDCTVCPTGNYCPIQSVTPTNCSAGTYGPNSAATSSSACRACPAGEYCPIATTSPVACAAGSYRSVTGGAQQPDCNACPVGQFCPQLSVTPTDCAAGSYRGSTGGAQQGDCTTCPTGNYCPIKSVDPTNCSIATYGPATGGTSAGSCLACPAGQYCPIATTAPISCAAGSYRGSTGAGAQENCAACPTGNYCPIKSIDPTNCSVGTYNPSASQTNAAACLACPAGDYCPVATTTPSLCTANTFSEKTGAAVCAQCPVFSTSLIGSINCTCDAGHYHVVTTTGGGSAAQSFSPVRLDSVYNNAAGNFFNYKFLQMGDSSHISVTKGSTITFASASQTYIPLKVYSKLYQSGALSDYLVTKTEVDSTWVGVQLADVIPVSKSMVHATQTSYVYSVGVTGSGTSTLIWDTTDVPSNLYFVGTQLSAFDAPVSVFVASPTPTTITYSPYVYNSFSLTAACLGDTLVLNKPTGDSRFNAANDIYVSCISLTDQNDPPAMTILTHGPPPLTWVANGVDSTMQCYISYGPLSTDTWSGGLEYYSLFLIYARPSAPGAVGNLVSILNCANCSSGYRSDPGAKGCTECGLGYYSNQVSQTCTVCPAGTKCPTTNTPAPVDCGAGFYQPQSTQSTCPACPAGQYCDLAKTVTPIDCPAGTYRETVGAASLADCQACPPGNYCPVRSSSPLGCFGGSYRSTPGATSQADCDICTVGNYCPYQSVNPTNCAAGSYRSSTGAQSQAQCDTCTTGHYCPIQSVNPTDCLAGTYNPSTGGTQPLDCLACPQGEFCPLAATTPTACSAGSYRGETGAKSQAECASCPSGNYCPIQSVNPTNCSAGTYNPSSSSVSPAACLSCPLGDYCHVATTSPSFCAAGSYRGSVGATDQTECTVCPSGNFCPIQSVDPVNCSSGTFRPTTAGAAVSDCSVCATGKYSMAIASSTDCPLCPSNNYCTDSITIKTCPTHTSSNAGSSSLLHCRCDQGFKCAYSKRITAVVTLNSTTSSFNNDVGGIKTAFINAVASAAGVSSNQVTINNVVAKARGRRLLSLDEGFIDVFTSVQGAERLRKLDLHLSRHSLTLHQGHSWQEAHSVTSTAAMRGATLATR